MTERFAAIAAPAVSSGIQTANILKKLDDNPALRAAATVVLDACAQERQEEAALLEATRAKLAETGDLPVQPLSAVVDMLVREGALVERLEVDGVAYAGTLEDAFEDASIPDDAQTLIYAEITEAGQLTLSEGAPVKRAESLFADKPEHAEAFLRTLQLCNVEGGISTASLGEALDAEGFLQRDPRTNIPHFYPSMFANFLKDVGCIEWHHGWVTTDLGREIAAA